MCPLPAHIDEEWFVFYLSVFTDSILKACGSGLEKVPLVLGRQIWSFNQVVAHLGEDCGVGYLSVLWLEVLYATMLLAVIAGV